MQQTPMYLPPTFNKPKHFTLFASDILVFGLDFMQFH